MNIKNILNIFTNLSQRIYMHMKFNAKIFIKLFNFPAMISSSQGFFQRVYQDLIFGNKWVLTRLVLVVIINYWTGYLLCDDINANITNPTHQGNQSISSSKAQWELVVLGVLCGISLMVCFYGCSQEFSTKIYPKLMSQEKLRWQNEAYGDLVERAENFHIKKELAREAQIKVLKGSRKKISAEEYANLESLTLTKKEYLIKYSKTILDNFDQKIKGMNNLSFQVYLDSPAYQVVQECLKIELMDPKLTINEYFPALRNNISKSITNLNVNYANYTPRELDCFKDFLELSLNNINIIDIAFKNYQYADVAYLASTHALMESLVSISSKLASDNFPTVLAGFNEVNTTFFGESPVDFISLHAQTKTLASVFPDNYPDNMVFVPHTFIKPERLDQIIADGDIVFPFCYNLMVVGSYGMLATFHFIFGTPNFIPQEVFKNSCINLLKLCITKKN